MIRFINEKETIEISHNNYLLFQFNKKMRLTWFNRPI